MSLYESIQSNDIESFKSLLTNPDKKMPNGYYPLLTCAYFNRVTMLKHLLSMDCNVFVMNEYRSNALHVAVYNCHYASAQLLVEAVPPLAMGVDKWGRTPLHTAAYNGSMRIMKLLIPHSDLTICDKYGYTPEQHTNFENAKKLLSERC